MAARSPVRPPASGQVPGDLPLPGTLPASCPANVCGPACPTWLPKVVPWVLLAAGSIAYWPSLGGVFVFDDQGAIVDNVHLRAYLEPSAWWADTTRPLVQFSLAMNYAFGGLSPVGYHVVNLIAHLLAGLVLYGLVRRTLSQPSIARPLAASATCIAGAAALVWEVHPLATSAVTYVIQRSEVFMGLCYLLTLYGLVRGVQQPPQGAGFRISGWHLLSAAACWAGMACKEVMVTAPVAALLYDRIFLAGSWREVAARRWGLYAAMFASWGLLAWLMTSAPKLFATVGFSQDRVSAWDYATNEPSVILNYLRLAFWPVSLSIDYMWPVRELSANLPGIVAVGILFAISIGLLLSGRVPAFRSLQRLGGPQTGFLLTAFFLILAPTSSFVPVADLAFEHRMYLPLAALTTLGVVAGYWLAQKATSPVAQPAALVVALAAAALLAAGTWARNQQFKSELTLWQAAVEARPENPRAHDQLGAALLKAGQAVPAVHHAKLAVDLMPNFAVAHNNLGRALDALHVRGAHPEAPRHYRRAIDLSPDFGDAHNNLANALLHEGKLHDALDHYRLALKTAANSAKIHYHIAVTLAKLGQLPQAIDEFEKALEMALFEPVDNGPLFVPLHIDLGETLAQAGNLELAKKNFQMALERQPDSASARAALGKVLLAQGKPAEAAAEMERAARLAPDRIEPHQALARLYLVQGKPDRAAQEFELVLKYQPTNAEALHFLGVLASDQGDAEKAADYLRLAIAARGGWAEPVLDLAWLMSTSPQASVRDGIEAVQMVENYCRSAGKTRARAWDVLAAAYAESGRFKDAVSAVEKAIDLATESKSPAEPGHAADEMQLRLQFYRTGAPFRAVRTE